jgi:hypothetical protein
MVQFLEGNYVLVRGKLKDAIGGRVEDRIASPHMLFAQFFDNLCSGSNLVADDFASNGLLEGFYEVRRKAMWIGG